RAGEAIRTKPMFHVHNIENVLKRDETTLLLYVSYITCASNLDIGEWQRLQASLAAWLCFQALLLSYKTM
ncbi:hypothetical protein VIGAN_05219600, partial [Vigna angularis var. angularis]